MGWFRKKKVVEIDISEAIEASFKKIQERSLEEINSLKLEAQSLRNELSLKQRVIDEQLEKLRQQNEADIFLQCEKIKHEILNGKKKEDLSAELSHLTYLQTQAASLNMQRPQNYWGAGLTGLVGSAIR